MFYDNTNVLYRILNTIEHEVLWVNYVVLSIIWSTFLKILISHVFLIKNFCVWTLHSCSLVDELILQCFTCSLPPPAVFMRYVTEIRCAVSMVDGRLLINMRYGFGPRGHPHMRMDGECVWGGGSFTTFKKKQGLKYCDLPLY